MMLGANPWRGKHFRYAPDTQEVDWPTRWHAWRRLCNLCPDLDRMHYVRHANQKPPPRPMTDAAFVALAACFANPLKRAALRMLVLDLIGDDIVELIQASQTAGK